MKEQSAPWDAFEDPRVAARFAELKAALREARDRLEAILEVCEFIDDETGHQSKATEATIATINKALGDEK